MSRASLEWMAGFFDGEGWLDVHKTTTTKGYTTWQLRAAITNTDRQLLEDFLEAFGGHIYRRKKVKTHHRETFTWVVGNEIALPFLKVMLPHVRAERNKARIALGIEFQTQKRRGGHRAKDGYSARQERFYERMRELTRRPHPQ